jgi:hypothetical protein
MSLILKTIMVAGVVQMLVSRQSAWVLVLLVAGALIVGACASSEPKLTLVVAGTAGLQYKGEWAVPGHGGGVESSLSETGTPSTFEVEGTIISLSFQKEAEEGFLRVEIREGSAVIVRLETQAPYGVVAIGTPVSQ